MMNSIFSDGQRTKFTFPIAIDNVVDCDVFFDGLLKTFPFENDFKEGKLKKEYRDKLASSTSQIYLEIMIKNCIILKLSSYIILPW